MFSKNFDGISRRAKIPNKLYQMDISVAHLSDAVLICIVCELETTNLVVFFNIFICLHATITNVIIP